MAGPPSKKSVRIGQAKRRQAPAAATDRPRDIKNGKTSSFAAIALFLGGTSVYFWLYLSAPLVGEVRRTALLSYLVRPEVMFQQWINSPHQNIGLFDRLPIFSTACLLFLAAGSGGYLFLKYSRIMQELTRIEQIVLSTGIGMNCLSLLALVIGLIGWLVPVVVIGSLGLILCTAFILWRRQPIEPTHSQWNDTGNGNQLDRLDWLCISLGIPFALSILLGSCLPPTDFDVCEYHLQVPKEWYLNGHINFLPHNVYGNMPLGAELPSMLAMAIIPGTNNWWWGALTGKVIIGGFSVLGALLLYAAGKRFSSPTVGCIAAVVYISTPWVGKVSMNGLVESVWGFYFFASFYVLLIWHQRMKLSHTSTMANGQHGNNQHVSQQKAISNTTNSGHGFLMAAGFLGGAAVACKYPAVLLVVCPLMILLFCAGSRTRPLSNRVGSITIYLLAAAVACGPWLLKNEWLADNPTYPLLVDMLGGKTRTPANNEQWKQAHLPPGYEIADLTRAAKKILWQNKFLSPALIPLIVCSFLRRKQRYLVAVQFMLIVYFVAIWWLLTHRIDRFLVPILPLLAWLAGLGACWSRETRWRAVVFGFLAVTSALNFVFFGTNVLADNRYCVPLRTIRDHEWIPGMQMTAHRYFNSPHFQGTRVLLVGDAQPFDIQIPVLYNTCFDKCIFEQLMQGRTATERLAVLHNAQISHIYVDWSEITRYRQTYGYSKFVQPEVFQELLQTGVLEQDDHFERFDSTNRQIGMYRVCGN